ncbi:uncharacterized protein GGS25DRAFT_42423 [Hypoxylon fragiforme]|uniref:uncharacterized protein n=1 Tax=Hypoxylon fragiforme TaxID=63214 RepID=UPI0020C5E2ED|nr:uncharacterized protein GGS25DRAFT_42423 [Hypoxylon fragiforme]KAI2614271.1 hypothetical protein GGS25DRAFT_42423 [Hypoxylon fragiforme]
MSNNALACLLARLPTCLPVYPPNHCLCSFRSLTVPCCLSSTFRFDYYYLLLTTTPFFIACLVGERGDHGCVALRCVALMERRGGSGSGSVCT